MHIAPRAADHRPRLTAFALAAMMASAACPGRDVDRGADRAAPNDNRTAAGTLRGTVLTLSLEAREAQWFPDGDDGPSLRMQMFAEAGRPTQNPGPLIRVPVGTTIQISVHNALRDST